MFSGLNSLLARGRKSVSKDFTPTARNALDRSHGAWWRQQLGGPASLFEAGKSIRSIRSCRGILDQLTADEYMNYVKAFYDRGLEVWGDSWVYQDINTVLYTAGSVLKPIDYMEIGVRRGRSAAMLLSQQPDCAFVGFDLWAPAYAGMENPGPDFVRAELKRVGHRGRCEFVGGDSKETAPRYFASNPEQRFDVITVDGDHSIKGASADLRNVLDRVKIGGVLVFDDTSNFSHPGLRDVWNRIVVKDERFASATFDEVGFGVGVATRKF